MLKVQDNIVNKQIHFVFKGGSFLLFCSHRFKDVEWRKPTVVFKMYNLFIFKAEVNLADMSSELTSNKHYGWEPGSEKKVHSRHSWILHTTTILLNYFTF